MKRASKTVTDDSAQARAMLDQVDELIGVLQQLRPWLEAQAEPVSVVKEAAEPPPVGPPSLVALVERCLIEEGPMSRPNICGRLPNFTPREIRLALGVSRALYDDINGVWRIPDEARAEAAS